MLQVDMDPLVIWIESLMEGHRMPYEVKAGENGTYDVVNKESGQVKATHQPPDAKEKAERQVALLHEVESDPEWESE
jgi:hypothetical protein